MLFVQVFAHVHCFGTCTRVIYTRVHIHMSILSGLNDFIHSLVQFVITSLLQNVHICVSSIVDIMQI